MKNKQATVAGIDVGGVKKGFHAVALSGGKYLDKFSSTRAQDMGSWCKELGATVIAVDAPCRWSITGRARVAERELMSERIWCFSTPTQDAAISHPRNHFGWMLEGAELYATLKGRYRLLGGCAEGSSVPDGTYFETFPHAIACALAGEIVSARTKGTLRRGLLSDAGIDLVPLTNIDFVDAALCALTAHVARTGAYKTYGDDETGLIVVPSVRHD